MSDCVAVGIDLGTTNSCIGAVRNGRVEIIANDLGYRVTPSCVAFTDEERLVGGAAKAQATWNPKNTLYDVKRLIGRKFDDESIQNGVKYWPFTVVTHEGNPKIEVEYKNERKAYTPEEISAMVLGKMKDTAETYFGCPVKDAVITVPAYFNDSQRQATIDAGTIAGFNVLGILNEPTAAAIAYGIDRKIQQKRNILIYDLGGGTFDVVVMTIEDGVFDVQAVGGNTNLGGADFDNLLVKHFAEEFKNKHKMDILVDSRATAKLRKGCEAAKRNLSSSAKERIQIESLFRGIDFSSSLSRGRLENICSTLFRGTMEVVEAVLKDSQLDKSQIHEVVLAGGSTRIPKIQNMLRMFFDKQINKTINPDEAVAYGAALHAAMLSRNSTVEEILLKDVTPLSLRILCNDRFTGGENLMSTIIPRNSKIPVKKSNPYTTGFDYLTSQTIEIFEGERKMARDNYQLGRFVLHNIESAPRYVPKLEVTFDIDSNGILNVTARDKKTGSTNDITVTTNKGRLQNADIERMVEEAKLMQKDDRQQRDRRKAQSALEAACHKAQAEVKYRVRAGRISSEGRSRVLQSCGEALAWVDSNQEKREDDCERQIRELNNLCAMFGINLTVQSDESSDEDD